MTARKVLKVIFKVEGFRESLELAIKGIVYLFLYHRNMRLIFMMGVAALLLGLYFKLRGIELVAMSITVTLVCMAEIFNTAIEMMMDILTEEYHNKIKLVKDIAAAVVVLTCLNAVAVAYIIFIRRLLR